MDSKELKDFLFQRADEGKVVVETIEGLQIYDVKEFIKQPTASLLYDLNRDSVTCATWLNADKTGWINNYACCVAITALKERIKELEGEQ